MSFNDIHNMPRGLEQLSMLVALNMGFNPLPTLPTVVRGLTNLVELNIDSTGEGNAAAMQ